MRINSDWRIETDPYNVILQQRKVSERGKNIGEERWEAVAFCRTHKDALQAMVAFEINVPQEYEAIVEKIDELTELITSLPLNG